MKNINELVATIPTAIQPYSDYYNGRNGGVAQRIAATLGKEYLGNVPHADAFISKAIDDGFYVVLARSIDLQLMNARQVNSAEAIYGGAFVDERLVDKTSLHFGVDQRPVYDAINADFLKQVDGLVIPGFSITNEEQLCKAFKLLSQRGMRVLRLKDATASDGRGQFVVTSEAEALHAYKSSGMTSAVLEQQLQTEVGELPANISVGFLKLPELGTFTVISKQIDLLKPDGRIMYGGAKSVLLRGDPTAATPSAEIAQALGIADPALLDTSVTNAAIFLKEFVSKHECLVSRITVDTLMSRVCDISCRVTGTDPFIQLALQAFKSNPEQDYVEGFVHLNYDAAGFEGAEQGENFLYHKRPDFPDHDLQIIAGIRELNY